MGLRAAWAFLRVDAALGLSWPNTLHDFALVAAVGLPPALEHRERFPLRCGPDCHCQALLRGGRLVRAVNVVECTRLQDAVAEPGAEAARDTGGLLFHASVPLRLNGQPVGVLNFATGEWQFLSAADLHLLSAVGAHVSLALERAQLYEQAQAQRSRLASELEMAREVQAALLPGAPPAIPGFRVAAYWRAAREIAGDLYDWFALPGGRWGLVVADVSDKGAPAALYMAALHSLLRAHAERASGPGQLLATVNRVLLRHAASGMFVTVFFAILEPARRRLTWSSAGHPPALLRRAGGQVEAVARGGLALGVLERDTWPEHELWLEPGNVLAAFTDGLSEALDPSGDEYGVERLALALAGASAAPGPDLADQVASAIVADLAAFTAGAVQSDDVTLLVIAAEAA
jgi:sigma-B regulation protein RsbU (phosphoserine phosphatase)